MLRFTVARLFIFCLALATIFAGCGDDDVTSQTVDAADEWIGAWQYMKDNDGALVPDGDRKILFTPEGTWQLSHDDETGTYIVFERRFHIDPSASQNKTGSWVRDGEILKLAYDDKTIRILQKTQSFQKYTPPPPPVYGPSATFATTVPIAGSEIASNTMITITLNEAVTAVTVNGAVAIGSGKTWMINLADLNLPMGSVTLNIGWRNKDDSAGKGAKVAFTIAQVADLGQLGPIAPNFTLENTEFKEVTLSDYKGKVVLLDFWATWCKPCEKEIPIYIELYDQYRARGFEMLGISLDEEGLEVVNPFIESLGVNYKILLAEPGIVEKYKLTAIPSAFLINRLGRIVKVFEGAQGKKAIYEKALLELL